MVMGRETNEINSDDSDDDDTSCTPPLITSSGIEAGKCNWSTLDSMIMRFRLRRAVTTTAFAVYLMFFLIYIYFTVNRESSSQLENNGEVKMAKIIEEETYVLPLSNSSDLSTIINTVNHEAKIRNYRKFKNISTYRAVIIVQVHNREIYLKELIKSLEKARYISQTLLIFSHDIYDDDINMLIQNIKFCRVLQIFYPWSMQIHQNAFPGPEENDCPRDISKKRAFEIDCQNAAYPDLYGHYREAEITQTKHHWWWKINKVMNGLAVTRNYNGPFVFLEEDHYVAEDFLYMLHLMKEVKNESCPSCNILTLGNYAKITIPQNQAHIAEYAPWVSSKHNMGMAITRTTWNKIKECSKEFCYHDDYNWDWTLQHVNVKCIPKEERLLAMILKFPRVFHIGECGIHHKGKDCAHSAALEKMYKVLNAAQKYLFPRYLKLFSSATNTWHYRDPKANGGWGDTRDHELCMHFTMISDENLPIDQDGNNVKKS
ncbi:Alpha-1,6-mannosyl-glycoprotein 2-beta-N-acetylglucosaminyltransferase [Nymphon striatum]|nr:Alpha-1,6-mannosyl-glycoprotein 2-beta-N-acetylglucosaminyltransferase [Nymphon striatum]